MNKDSTFRGNAINELFMFDNARALATVPGKKDDEIPIHTETCSLDHDGIIHPVALNHMFLYKNQSSEPKYCYNNKKPDIYRIGIKHTVVSFDWLSFHKVQDFRFDNDVLRIEVTLSDELPNAIHAEQLQLVFKDKRHGLEISQIRAESMCLTWKEQNQTRPNRSIGPSVVLVNNFQLDFHKEAKDSWDHIVVAFNDDPLGEENSRTKRFYDDIQDQVVPFGTEYFLDSQDALEFSMINPKD